MRRGDPPLTPPNPPTRPNPKESLAAAAAAARPFDFRGYAFAAAPEELRPPRMVRIGLVQNAVVAQTTAPFAEQRQVRRGAWGRGRAPRRAGR